MEQSDRPSTPTSQALKKALLGVEKGMIVERLTEIGTFPSLGFLKCNTSFQATQHSKNVTSGVHFHASFIRRFVSLI